MSEQRESGFAEPFTEWEEGEWHEPVHDGYLMECCDCGLVHRVDFAVRGRIRRQVQMRVFRDEEATEAKRAPMVCFRAPPCPPGECRHKDPGCKINNPSLDHA